VITDNFNRVDRVIESCNELKKLREQSYIDLNESSSKAYIVQRLQQWYSKKAKDSAQKVISLEKDIGFYCDEYNTIEPLVVGLFGEWGSGKTHLLKGIKYKISTQQEKNLQLWESAKEESEKPCHNIVPVFFNAWRFENEEHIIIPLFKTMLYTLGEYRGIPHYQKIYSKLKILSFALISNLQVPSLKQGLKLFSGDIEQLKDIAGFFNWKNIKKDSSHEEMLKDLIEDGSIDSIYLKIPKWIEKITIIYGIRFVFLIDDLDRSLPENTLKILESIKLFLDVPGCSFVLAVDDDVVERGVEHHYKSYKKSKKEIPITGNEYLEKMIQLPFRIPPLDDIDLEKYILDNYKEVFEYETYFEKMDNKSVKTTDMDVVKFFIDTTPPTLRKLIRAANLYKTKLKIISNIDSTPDRLLIAKLTLLELFAPKLFRFIKHSGYHHIFERLILWRSDESIESLTESDKIGDWIKTKDIPQEEKELYKNLLKIITELNGTRSLFKLDRIFTDIDFKKLESYIKLKEIKKDQPNTFEDSNKQIVEPSDKKRFYEYIFSGDTLSWQKAFDDKNLKDNYLKLSSEFKQKAEKFIVDPKWLEIVSNHTNKKDFKKFIEELKPIERLLSEK
jgi:hypothetical protein